ncbi:hypothetical protein MPF_0338 [Methanohalophilus portucalensis FDF-1]|uniref:Uncharacterized protein n=1 Tax=Methanohalophilus portucalensis FDF-1 TaxID=523843 RepID=A0A1L9C4U7_9EURY|nr:hypothetical protein MPF_0338 [Methanohalophilus portucalensis FDF-1]
MEMKRKSAFAYSASRYSSSACLLMNSLFIATTIIVKTIIYKINPYQIIQGFLPDKDYLGNPEDVNYPSLPEGACK